MVERTEMASGNQTIMRVISLSSLLLLPLLLMCACEVGKQDHTQGSEIFPPRNIGYAALWQLNGLGINTAFFRDHWSLVIIEDTDCRQACLQRLELIAAVNNVQRLFVAADAATHGQMRNIANHSPGVEIAMGTTAASVDSFRRQLSAGDFNDETTAHPVYVVNPHAEVILTYPGAGEPAGLQKELQRLRAQW
jgi:hypothetical protein